MRLEDCVAIWHTYFAYNIIKHKHWERNYNGETNNKACDFYGFKRSNVILRAKEYKS